MYARARAEGAPPARAARRADAGSPPRRRPRAVAAMQRMHKEHRIREEIANARRDRDFYLSRVDQAKAIEAMESRRAGGDAAAADGGTGAPGRGQFRKREFKQRTAPPKAKRRAAGEGLLSALFQKG